jgi:hypothetical protein
MKPKTKSKKNCLSKKKIGIKRIRIEFDRKKTNRDEIIKKIKLKNYLRQNN